MNTEALGSHLTYLNNALTMLADIEKRQARQPLDFNNPQVQELIKLCLKQIIQNAVAAKQILNKNNG